jgi:methyltransferase (TIGR00027 family)
MRKGKPSGTSTTVAFWRGLNTLGVTHVRGFTDPFAVDLLPPLPGYLLRAAGLLFKRFPGAKDRFLTGSTGMIDMIALRSRAIDASWADAFEAGVRQLVILGAGLDARAYRLPKLSEVRVFEVDHPDTQAYKRQRAKRLHSNAAVHSYVGVDFSMDDLARSLRNAGLRTDERSHFIWEGVTHYLPHAATAATLAAIRCVTAEGSQLVATYAEPEGENPSARTRVRQLIFRWVGEPQIGLLERGHMAKLLTEAGWHVARDEGADDLARRFGGDPAVASLNLRERVVLAEAVGRRL